MANDKNKRTFDNLNGGSKKSVGKRRKTSNHSQLNRMDKANPTVDDHHIILFYRSICDDYYHHVLEGPQPADHPTLEQLYTWVDRSDGDKDAYAWVEEHDPHLVLFRYFYFLYTYDYCGIRRVVLKTTYYTFHDFMYYYITNHPKPLDPGDLYTPIATRVINCRNAMAQYPKDQNALAAKITGFNDHITKGEILLSDHPILAAWVDGNPFDIHHWTKGFGTTIRALADRPENLVKRTRNITPTSQVPINVTDDSDQDKSEDLDLQYSPAVDTSVPGPPVGDAPVSGSTTISTGTTNTTHVPIKVPNGSFQVTLTIHQVPLGGVTLPSTSISSTSGRNPSSSSSSHPHGDNNTSRRISELEQQVSTILGTIDQLKSSLPSTSLGSDLHGNTLGLSHPKVPVQAPVPLVPPSSGALWPGNTGNYTRKNQPSSLTFRKPKLQKEVRFFVHLIFLKLRFVVLKIY